MLGNKPGDAYLTPRRDKKSSTLKCQLLIGYRGFIALAHRTGKVSSIYPAIVHQGDQFSLKLGTGRQLVHVPVLDPAKRGDWIGAYAFLEKQAYTKSKAGDTVNDPEIDGMIEQVMRQTD